MYSKETLALMEAAVDAVIVIDHQGIIAAVNGATSKAFGYSRDELLGKNVSMLMPEPHRGRHDDFIANYLKTREPRIIGIGREVIAQRRDGSVFPVQLSVGEIAGSSPPRFVGLLRDITAEHEATAALKLERDRANAYLELNDHILLRIDSERRIVEVNGRGSELLGAPRDDIRGRDWLDFIDGTSERERARFMLSASLGSGYSREREFDSLDCAGGRLRVYWRCIALRSADGTPAGWLMSGSDITDRARREEQAMQAQERMTRVARLASMGEMAAGIAHELNQPLTAITTYARACERYLDMPEPDFHELRESVREIGAEGLRAGKIIDRLRQLVRNEENEARALLDVNPAIDELRVLLRADARAYGANLDIELTPGLPRVAGNAVQLQQVVLNLVRNAFEAVGESRAEVREVRLRTARDSSGDIEISVTDNGPGIPPAIRDRLFHPFATTKKTGTGLGLAMSRTLVQAHGGTIGTRPVAPHGACVWVKLPPAEEAA